MSFASQLRLCWSADGLILLCCGTGSGSDPSRRMSQGQRYSHCSGAAPPAWFFSRYTWRTGPLRQRAGSATRRRAVPICSLWTGSSFVSGLVATARARLAGSPRSGVLCLTSFSSGRNTRCAPGKEPPLIFRSTPMHGKGRIQKHGLRNTLESIVPAHKCQTVMIPCPAFWNPVSVFSVLLFFLFPFAAGWLGKTEPRKSGDSRLSGTFRPYR